MSPATTMPTSNRIANPFQQGQRVLIPAGTPVRSMNPRKKGVFYTKRAHTVLIRMVADGHVDLWNDAKRGKGYVHLPTITWAGGSGYWHDVKVTPEFAERVGGATLTLPEFSDYERHMLDAEPGFGPGYDNRDA